MIQVAIGLIGVALDRGFNADRWDKWRPTVSLFQHDDLLIDRFELLHEPRDLELVERVAADIRQVSPETDVRRGEIRFGRDPWDFEAVYTALFDWARGYEFKPETERYLIHITTGTHVAQICSFLLNEAGYLPGALIQTSPPRKRKNERHSPASYNIIDLDLSKYDQIRTRFERAQIETTDLLKQGIATRNDAFNRMIDEIERVARLSKEPILLTGPTGAGKSQLARQIHELRKRSLGLKGRFVDVNCATLRGELAASTLFGHVKGAFTGAQRERAGLLREADGGMLFLDEIGELGLDEQATLLQALEEKQFYPVGSDQCVSSDFQLIAGTNRNLSQEVQNGRFRHDLLARIHLWSFHLPSLADRREDIEPNLDYELERFGQTASRNVQFNAEARARFLKFALAPDSTWTGNFRDLNAAVTRMGALANKGRIGVADVDAEIQRLKRSWEPTANPEETPNLDLLEAILGPERVAELDPFDRVQLAYVLKTCRDAPSLSQAGRLLFAESRKKRSAPNDADRLKKYLAKYGLEFRDL